MGKFYPKQSGTTEQSFEIGAGHNKNGLTIDVTALAGDQTWVIPSTEGSFGDTLTTDGAGNLSWAPPGAANDTTVPTYIAPTQTYRVNEDRQALFAQDIVVDGDLVIDGALIDVGDKVTTVTPGSYQFASITVDSLGRLTAASSGATAPNTVVRNDNGFITGDNNLVVDTTTATKYFNALTPGAFVATFGASSSSFDANAGNRALFINNTSNNGITLRTTDSTATKSSDLAIFSGGQSRPSGSPAGGALSFTSGSGIGSGTASNASGGAFTFRAGNGDVRSSSTSTARAGGGRFDFIAGTAFIDSQIGATGGNFRIGAGDAVKGSIYAQGATAALDGGIIEGSTYTGGQVSLTAGDGDYQPGSRGGDVNIYPGRGTVPGQVYINRSNLVIANIGSGVSIAEGTDAKMGLATLVAGTVTVSNTSVTAASRIFLTIQSANGGIVGQVYINGIVPATGFTISSTSALDTSVIAYQIIEAV